MNIFIEDRIGTPITDQERKYLEGRLLDLEASKSPEKVQASIKTMTELCGSWDQGLEFMCIDHDIDVIQTTLDTGLVHC